MPESKRRGMVYVIDDDESVRKALKRLLRSADLDVETFSSAEEFLSNSRQGAKRLHPDGYTNAGLNRFRSPEEAVITGSTDTGHCDFSQR